MNAIIGTLKTNGLLFYQTFTREKVTDNSDYRLAKNELLALFVPLTLMFYQENSLVSNSRDYETKRSLSDKKLDSIMIENLNPQQAWDFLQQTPHAVLIDVRTKAEYTMIGHPTGAIHIAWQKLPDWQLNPGFVAEVIQTVPDRCTPVLLLCRSGQRSLNAAKALEQAGYESLINIIDGFEGSLDKNHHRSTLGGWRFQGLPWEQS